MFVVALVGLISVSVASSPDSISDMVQFMRARVAHESFVNKAFELDALCLRIVAESRGIGREILPMDQVMIAGRLSTWVESDSEDRLLIEQGLREFANLRSFFVMNHLLNNHLAQYKRLVVLSARDLLYRRLSHLYRISAEIKRNLAQCNSEHLREIFRKIENEASTYKGWNNIRPIEIFRLVLSQLVAEVKSASSAAELTNANGQVDNFLEQLRLNGYSSKTIWDISCLLITPLLTQTCSGETAQHRAHLDAVMSAIVTTALVDLLQIEETLALTKIPDPEHLKYLNNPFEI